MRRSALRISQRRHRPPCSLLRSAMRELPPPFRLARSMVVACEDEEFNKRHHSCPSCEAGFKSANTATLLSLAFPGIGDFYLGHLRFALMEMSGEKLFQTALTRDFLPDFPANGKTASLASYSLMKPDHVLPHLVNGQGSDSHCPSPTATRTSGAVCWHRGRI